MKMQDFLILGGAAAAAFYFFGSSASSAAPSAPTDTQGDGSQAPQDYNTQTGQGSANSGTGADYQSHNPYGVGPYPPWRRSMYGNGSPPGFLANLRVAHPNVQHFLQWVKSAHPNDYPIVLHYAQAAYIHGGDIPTLPVFAQQFPRRYAEFTAAANNSNNG